MDESETVEVILDGPRRGRFSFWAMRDIEVASGQAISDWEDKTHPFEQCALLCWAAIKQAEPGLTFEDFRKQTAGVGMKAWFAAADAFREHLKKVEAGESEGDGTGTKSSESPSVSSASEITASSGA